MLARILKIALLLAGFAAGSQAPEFAQQYRQRLGGAIDELAAVARDFDRDAAGSGLGRPEAIDRLRGSNDPFVRDRGASISVTMDRLHALQRQLTAMNRVSAAARPMELLRDPDPAIAWAAWKNFEPAIPLGAASLFWGGIGALLGLPALAFGRRRRIRVEA